jgi:hypothetical protein
MKKFLMNCKIFFNSGRCGNSNEKKAPDGAFLKAFEMRCEANLNPQTFFV